MTITPWIIYWITRLDGIKDLSQILTMTGVLAAIAFSLFFFALYNEKDNPKFLLIWIFPIVFGIVVVLTPSTKEMAMIYIIPKIANNDAMQEIPGDLKMIKDMAMDNVKSMLEEEK